MKRFFSVNRITIKTLNPSTALAVSNQVFIETSKPSEVENVRESYSEEKKNSLNEQIKPLEVYLKAFDDAINEKNSFSKKELDIAF